MSLVAACADRNRRAVRRFSRCGALLIGLLAVHFLSGHDFAGDHRLLTPAAITAGHDLGGSSFGTGGFVTLGAEVTHEVSSDPPVGAGHLIVTGCALLLLAAAAGLVALLLLRRWPAHRRPGMCPVRSPALRGPPKPAVRLALCVERI